MSDALEAAFRAYSEAINDLAARVTELELQISALNQKSLGDHVEQGARGPVPEVRLEAQVEVQGPDVR